MGLVSLQEKERPELPFSPICEGTVRRWLSASQQEGRHQEPNWLPPLLWTFQPHNYQREVSVVEASLSTGISIQEPELTKTRGEWPDREEKAWMKVCQSIL